MRRALLVLLATAGLLIGPAAGPAAAYPPVSYRTYHYDLHCQPHRLIYAGEPDAGGTVVKWWYVTVHTVYTPFDKYWHGFADTAVTDFSHREYTWARCSGVW